MKVPINWLKDYVQTDKSAEDLAKSFTQLGLMLDKPYDGQGVLDLEHRMDRADWLSVVGVARDLAAFENLPLIEPNLYGKNGKVLKDNEQIKIKVETPHVRRFSTRVFKGIKVGESPVWLKERLTAYGIDTKNNIVDITNYVMVELGQTMHAQDIAKMHGEDITIRQAKSNEKVVTLLGTEVTLDPDVFVLTSGGVVTVIGGIVGGKNTGVTESTTDIILDAGNYDQAVIRKTSRRLKIINESVSRNDKFLDPRLCEIALNRATGLILELAGGTYYDNYDYYPSPVEVKTQKLTYTRLKLISGMDFRLKEIKRILKSLGFEIVEENEFGLTVEIPYFRTDIEVEDDLIADILRISNYENIPLTSLTTPVPIDITPAIYLFEDRLRDILVSLAVHEHITSPLVKSDGKPNQVILANALSTDQNALRTTHLENLQRVLTNYHKHNEVAVTVFEIGLTFALVKGNYIEKRELTTVGEDALTVFASLMTQLGLTYFINNEQEIIIDDIISGSVSPSHFTLDTQILMSKSQTYSPILSEFAHNTTRDISLLVESGITYYDIQVVLSKLKLHWKSFCLVSITPLDTHNNYLLRFTWEGTSEFIESDKFEAIAALTKKLKIVSKS